MTNHNTNFTQLLRSEREMHSRSPSPAKQIKNFISPTSDDKKPLTAPEAANSARLAKDPKKSVT